MRRHIAVAVITVGIAATVVGQDKSGFVTQEIGLMPTAQEKISAVSAGDPSRGKFMSTDAGGTTTLDWAAYFRGMGMKWPDGSSVRMDPLSGKLIVTNTPENLELLARILGTMGLIPYQIEIELYFVQFDKTDIAALAVERRLNADELRTLWKKGKAELLFAPRVVTQSGCEATVKGVTETIYPTEVGMATTQSNALPKVVELSAFETREVGVIFTVLPEKSSDSSLIHLTLTPEIVGAPEWRAYGETVKTGKEETQRSIIEQPFFHTQSLSTSLSIDNGETLLIGGGMPSKTEGKAVYAFITAQLVDTKGNPIKMRTDVEQRRP
jgi:type II secretory pathway component GspD/PulD (secretin)